MDRTLIPDRKTPSKPRSFYERRYKAAARVYSGNKASMVRQNNHQIAKYVESVNPVPRNFIPPPKLKARDLIIDTGELHEEDLGKRYWLVRTFSAFALPALTASDRSVKAPRLAPDRAKSTRIFRACTTLTSLCLPRAHWLHFCRIASCSMFVLSIEGRSRKNPSPRMRRMSLCLQALRARLELRWRMLAPLRSVSILRCI